MSAHPSEPAVTPPGNYERADFPTRPILVSLAAMCAIVIFVFLAMYALGRGFVAYSVRTGPKANPLAASAPQLPPAPRLQNAPTRDIAQMRAAEDEVLNHYAWLDKQAGTVRIPIQRAIDLLADRGLPSRTSGGGTQ